MIRITILVFVLALLGCNKKIKFDGPDQYQDDFEMYSSRDQLIDGNDDKWSFFQLSREQNDIRVDTLIVHSGQRSIRFDAIPSSESEGASKASINKQFMAFWEGETVRMSAWYYLTGDKSADWLFLFDLEEKVPVGAGPGMRLALVDDKILLEHKYPNPNVEQEGQGVVFPRDQWVHIEFETLLSRKKKGHVKVWQDGALILEKQDWQTLPKDILYFNQGTKGMYNQIEFGLTANTRQNSMTLYVDDVLVWTE